MIIIMFCSSKPSIEVKKYLKCFFIETLRVRVLILELGFLFV